MRAYKDPTADTAIANVMKEQKKTIGRKAQGRSKGHPQRKVRRCRNRDQGYTEIGENLSLYILDLKYFFYFYLNSLGIELMISSLALSTRGLTLEPYLARSSFIILLSSALAFTSSSQSSSSFS